MVNDNPSFYLLNPLKASLSAADAESWLGRIVANYKEPLTQTTPSDPSFAHGKVVTTPDMLDAHQLLDANKGSAIYARLIKALGMNMSSTNSQELSFHSP